MSEITTYKKRKFDPLSAAAEEIDIEDIAHALSLLCRANGHVPHFYSVAQHSVNCVKEAMARGYSKRVQLGCLLHDASEAYLSDITRPVKSHLGRYLEIEQRLQSEIYGKWIVPPLTEDEIGQISEIDNTLLYHEFLTLMEEVIAADEPIIMSCADFSCLDFAKTEAQFLRLFWRLIHPSDSYTIGVDWCQGDWMAAKLENGIGSYERFASLSELCEEYADVSHILIDAPIGLSMSAEEMAQRPDTAARQYLKVAARKSAIFPVPFRQMVYAADRKTVWELNRELGGKMTPMGLGLLSCIQQVDTFLQGNPQWIERLVESHPECAFQALNGGHGVNFSKHTAEGIAERVAILSSYVANVEELLANASPKIRNDLLDALCLAVVSSRSFTSVQQEVFRDRLGFPMRIVIPVE